MPSFPITPPRSNTQEPWAPFRQLTQEATVLDAELALNDLEGIARANGDLRAALGVGVIRRLVDRLLAVVYDRNREIRDLQDEISDLQDEPSHHQ